MTHISKQSLPSEQLGELFGQLSMLIARLDKKNAPVFFEEFFGVEEQVMFAKRLAAIIMCIEGHSIYRIFTTLKISPSTAERIKLNHQIGKYRAIKKIITENKTEYHRLLHVLEVILQAGLPPRGKGRWKRLFANQ